MKKLLILILIVLLLTLSFLIGVKGVNMGNFEILGIKGIQKRNTELDDKIQQAARLAQKDFKQAITDVQSSATKLKNTKGKYLELLPEPSEDGTQTTTVKKYEIETLWVKVGNHATAEGATIKMDVKQGATSSVGTSSQAQTNTSLTGINGYSSYNLEFTVNGSYISITDFISSLENDAELGFKIEQFKLEPSDSTSNLKATFVCYDILIKNVDTSAVTTKSKENDNENNKENSNTTNSTNNTNTANTSNTNGTDNTNNASNTANTSNTTNTTGR